MNIQGLQKLTLLDYPEHVACTLFTAGCQLNCPYCHNSALIAGPFDESIQETDVLAFLKKRQGLLDGVCVSGGEPLLQADIVPFLASVKDLGYRVKLDTNGGFPDKLEELIEQGLVDYVAMDIKNRPERYAETCGVASLDLTPYIRSCNLLLEGRVGYEFRTTIVREFHTFEDIAAIGKWLQGAQRYYLQSFVDRDQVRDHSLSAHNEERLKAMLEAVQQYVPNAALRGI
ncbi:MAG: anaerobic ribonucleoside-triphosphate reductase activating protein [Peptococcaceae bacterium]|nr:anaerobic ribonucleoside-triphosphate reductase activating protein [Peptococcaceae bacterium]